MSKLDKVLIVGGGGREHSLGCTLGQSEHVGEVLYAPGNGGTESGTSRNVPIDGSKKENFSALAALIFRESIDLIVVGPEQPLADGLVDFLNGVGISRVVGPTRKATRIESSKFYSFDIMEKAGVFQAEGIKCYTVEEAQRAIHSLSTDRGVVPKYEGLAAGKGVIVCDSEKEALERLGEVTDKGNKILVSKRLFGQEFSVFAMSDGERATPFQISLQDHKRLLDGDKGLNTGGMGAYGPAPIAPFNVVQYVAYNIMTSVVQEMKKDGAEYKGPIYGGFMQTGTRMEDIAVIEFNARFGDPETPPLMMMLEDDLYEIFSLGVEGKSSQARMRMKPGAACTVVMASQGYPGDIQKGLPLVIPDDLGENVMVFHAGTAIKDGKLVTNGGRVLEVTAYDESGLRGSLEAAYRAAEIINKATVRAGGQELYMRTDIGDKALTE